MAERRLVQWTEATQKKIDPPERAFQDDAGFDLECSVNIELPPGKPTKVATGIRIANPPDLWCRIIGRSSTIWRYGVQVLEGVIDTGWRGELFIIVINHRDEPVTIERGTRLAQIIFHRRIDVDFEYVDELPASDRGTCGFGSSGR